MSVGTSIFLIAIGAILRFAVRVHTNGFSLDTIGVILMIAGGLGLVLSFLWLMAWRNRGTGRGDARYDERS